MGLRREREHSAIIGFGIYYRKQKQAKCCLNKRQNS